LILNKPSSNRLLPTRRYTFGYLSRIYTCAYGWKFSASRFRRIPSKRIWLGHSYFFSIFMKW